MKTLVIVLALQLTGSVVFAAGDDCQGCKAVQEATLEFRSLTPGSGQAPQRLLEKGLNAVEGLKTSKGNRLTNAQIQELVKLIEASEPHDQGGFVVDGDMRKFKANRAALIKEAGRLTANRAGAVIQTIENAANADRSE